MIGLGLVTAAIGALLLWVTRKGRAPTSKWLVRGAVLLPFLPVAANSFGWIFTEMGRQPWIVFGVMTTANGVSPSVECLRGGAHLDDHSSPCCTPCSQWSRSACC